MRLHFCLPPVCARSGTERGRWLDERSSSLDWSGLVEGRAQSSRADRYTLAAPPTSVFIDQAVFHLAGFGRPI